MAPNKIYWYLGACTLAMLTDQDRKHWLMKTDKIQNVQDPISGSSFSGQIDNKGSDIILETQKLPVQDDVVKNGTFSSENVSDIFDIASSVFPLIPECNGLEFVRLKSINLMGSDNAYHNFRLVLKNCTVVYIPMSMDQNSDQVFVYKWYRTTTAPVLQSLDTNQEFTIETSVTFSSGVTNPVFYYPADEVIQPIELDVDSSDTLCETILITDPMTIGLPLFWFTCDESRIGPYITFSNTDTSQSNPRSRLLEIGHVGSESNYLQHVYPATGDADYAAQTSDMSDWLIRCAPADGNTFQNDDTDFDIGVGAIQFVSQTAGVPSTNINRQSYGTNLITMHRGIGWTYEPNTQMYEISLDTFEQNLYSYHNNLIPAFDLRLDQRIPFQQTTSDIGYAGIQMGSSKHLADMSTRYPHDIQNLEGLPDWIRNPSENATGQQMTVYALHNTPNYAPQDQSTRQIAGFILDPGVERTYSDPQDNPMQNSEFGRVYLISNDGIEYENNAKSEFPKPARTIARICDIPTSVMQLTNISGLAPTSIVDKKYVRSYASYTESDQSRIYNDLKDRWVKPTNLDANGVPIYSASSEDQSNAFVFDSVANLNRVDMYNMNDFRVISNLNPMVDPSDVSVYQITNGGSGYVVGSVGTIVIGGFSFTYTVNTVDDDGGATSVSIAPDQDPTLKINLSNFDLYENSAITVPYGTSPLASQSGTGLKVQLQIANYESLLPVKGDFVDGLYAFVNDTDGIWLYAYEKSGTSYTWTKLKLIAPSNASDTVTQNGSVTTKDSYLSSILPSVRQLTVSKLENRLDEVSLSTFATASSLNVIDTNSTPVWVPSNSGTGTIDSKNVIDINKLYFRGTSTGLPVLTAESKTVNGVITALKSNGVAQYDSYVAWRWVSNSASNKQFEYGIIHRSLNNLISQSNTSLLPENDLLIKNYVHTNLQTTIMWNVDHVGPMVWMFDPYTSIHERYYVDANTRDLYVTHNKFDWNDVEFTTATRETIPLISNGILQFNILTNNPAIVYEKSPSSWNTSTVIYQQPDYVQLADLMIGQRPATNPIGGWRLIFPDIHSFKLTNTSDPSIEYTPTRLNVLRDVNVPQTTDVLNDENLPVNYKTLLVDESSTTGRVSLRLYNPTTGNWDTV